jgi:general secretion pathway protein E
MTVLAINAEPATTDATHEQPTLRAELVSARFRGLIPGEFAREHLVISQGEDESGTELLAAAPGCHPCVVHNIGVRLGALCQVTTADPELIARLVDAVYIDADAPTDAVHHNDDLADIDALVADADKDLLVTRGKAPVVKLIDAFLFEALGRRASDVHIHPTESSVLVRYRIDGVLHTVRTLPRNLAQPLISRVKVMGRMDVAERRMPQDGRTSVTLGERSVDLRISSIPTSSGERAVIRILDRTTQVCDLGSLGLPPEVKIALLHRGRMANGIILATGPTGSGKTTTLYSLLRAVGSSELNIMTIEDPIEYQLGSEVPISQSQVAPRKGVTFATGLRHILRQDPDVIMIGEIRDGETARIAVQSSLTGHLVLSTLHTNDAPSAVARLFDLDVEPFLLSASLSAVLAQRLVRVVHTQCRGKGCEGCSGSGFRGRIGVFEFFAVDEHIRGMIARGASTAELRKAACSTSGGMRTLAEEGDRLVREGRTTELEVKRVLEAAL